MCICNYPFDSTNWKLSFLELKKLKSKHDKIQADNYQKSNKPDSIRT